ncbi:MAG TPA: hypothetical protein DCS92_03605 [Gammaproteobacteria bacterium]|nr:hypothetical protein [Gammaproteobacteria bacterium]
MLTIQSYLTAMLIYWVVAVIGVVLMRRLWFATPLTLFAGATLGAIGGVLLVPAFSAPEVQSMAPALIIVVFNTLFGEGLGSALVPALWLLGGALLGAVGGFFWARRQAGRASL